MLSSTASYCHRAREISWIGKGAWNIPSVRDGKELIVPWVVDNVRVIRIARLGQAYLVRSTVDRYNLECPRIIILWLLRIPQSICHGLCLVAASLQARLYPEEW